MARVVAGSCELLSEVADFVLEELDLEAVLSAWSGVEDVVSEEALFRAHAFLMNCGLSRKSNLKIDWLR